MTTLRATLRLHSALATPLAADTLFGHVCWGIVYHEGTAALAEFLSAMSDGTPPLVLSDPLPAGCWPMPLLPPLRPEDHEALLAPAEGDGEARIRAFQRLKSVRKREWLPHRLWNSLASRLGPRALTETLLAADAPPPALVPAPVPHATIDRFSGGTLREHGFHVDRQWFPPGPVDFDLWVRTTLPTERVHMLLAWGLEGGYGRDASTGKGHLTLEQLVPDSLPTVNRANAVVLLGPCAPTARDPAIGTWDVEVRIGRLGGNFATGGAAAATPFKYPVVFLARGSVLLTDDPPPLLGRMVPNVHPTRPEVVTCGYALTLPARLAEEAMPCRPTT